MNRHEGKNRRTAPARQIWRTILHEVIFEAETPAGKGFDLLLIISILASVGAVMLDSIGSVRSQHGGLLYRVEWFFTILFSIEYLLRILCVDNPLSMRSVSTAWWI